MHRSKSGFVTLVACLLAFWTVACNKRPAEEALQAAEQALAASTEVERYEPAEFAAVSAILREGRASYAAGRYTDALRAAQTLPDRIAAAASGAAKRREQSASAWRALSADVPPRLEALAARLMQLSTAAAVSSERLATAQAELGALSQAWAAATTAYDSGDVPSAVAAANEASAKAKSLAERLGLKPVPPTAATAPAAAPVP